MIEKIRIWARALIAEIAVLAAAIRDPRTPWYAKALGMFIVGYAVSPIDLIPDFIPILGFIDEALLLPIGIWAVRRMIPAEVMAEHRANVAAGTRLPPNRTAAAIIIGLWIAGIAVSGWWAWNRYVR